MYRDNYIVPGKSMDTYSFISLYFLTIFYMVEQYWIHQNYSMTHLAHREL